MNPLDDLKTHQKLDSHQVYQSVIDLPKQCQHAWDTVKTIDLPQSYQNISSIVMTGMGGSGLGARIIKSLYSQTIKYPLEIINDYHLPSWVNHQTLVFCSSYSGNTEETLSCAHQAIKQKAKWLAICTNGKLLDLVKKHKVPCYQIKPVHNPSNQPRMAIGYSLIGQLALATKAKLIHLLDQHLTDLITCMDKVIKTNQVSVPLKDNPAKQTAEKLFKHQVILTSAEHLTGAVHTLKNQMNENAKQLSHRHDLPELNHHLMEGLRFPQTNQSDIIFWFINSSLYSPRLQKRLKITQQVVAKNHINSITFQPASSTKLSQIFELIQYGALVNYYLAILNQIDPADVPWVDYFKKQLA